MEKPEPPMVLMEMRSAKTYAEFKGESRGVAAARVLLTEKPVEFMRQIVSLEREHQKTLAAYYKGLGDVKPAVEPKDKTDGKQMDLGTQQAMDVLTQFLEERARRAENAK